MVNGLEDEMVEWHKVGQINERKKEAGGWNGWWKGGWTNKLMKWLEDEMVEGQEVGLIKW
jgi:hypothetical protein